jgi:hypothetical protein
MRKYFLITAAIGIIAVFTSWGFLIHRTVNQMAVYELPKKMRPFFYRNMAYLVKESVRIPQRFAGQVSTFFFQLNM